MAKANNADYELAGRFVDFLNSQLEHDRVTIASLIAIRVPCSEAMANHPTIQVAAQHGGYLVGLLGLINGMCGIDENGNGAIAAEFDDGATPEAYRNLGRFVVNKPRATNDESEAEAD